MHQETNSAARGGKVEFDLLSNPFARLRIPPTASKEEIAEAFNEAIAEGWADDEILRDARRQLLAPKLRLAATVDMLVDATPQQRDLALAALRDGVPLSDLQALTKDLPHASRAVFISNITQLRPSSGALRLFTITIAAIDRPSFDAKIGAIFEEAGLPAPNAASIQEAFDAATARNLKRLFSAYDNVKSASSDITRCMLEGMPSSTGDQLAAYTSLLVAYQQYAESSIRDLRDRVVASTGVFLENMEDAAVLDRIETDLRSWDQLSQPAQLLAQHKGRDDPQARELFEHLRAFMITMANDKTAPAAALRLSKVCNQVFAELPRAAAQLKEDLGALQNLVDQEGARALIEFVAEMRSSLDPLVNDLKRGFDTGSRGRARRLFQLFEGAVTATKGTEASDIPWVVVRGLALDINNNLEEGAASEAIISGLINHSGFNDASPELRTAIRTDHRVLLMNSAQARLKRAIDKRDTADARFNLQTMVGLATDENERRQYQQAIVNLDAAKRGRLVRRAFWGILILIGIVVAANQINSRSSSSLTSTSNRPSTTTSYSPQAQPPAAVDDQEIKPIPYSVLTYSRGNVRYCLFERARLEAIDKVIMNETDRVIALYNDVIDDYNSRCSNYQYYVDDLTAIQREVASSPEKINADIQIRLQGWRMSN